MLTKMLCTVYTVLCLSPVFAINDTSFMPPYGKRLNYEQFTIKDSGTVNSDGKSMDVRKPHSKFASGYYVTVGQKWPHFNVIEFIPEKNSKVFCVITFNESHPEYHQTVCVNRQIIVNPSSP